MTVWDWGLVTSTAPLMVRRLHESVEIPADSLVAGLTAGARVRCEFTSGPAIIHGVAGGGRSRLPGAIHAYAGATAPAGALLCDGSLVSRTAYAKLFAAIGTTYGAGNGSTTFALPNMKGRTVVGRDAAQTEFDVLGEAGGAKTHTLTTPEMPSHTHVQDSHNHTQNSHSHQAGTSVEFLVVSSGGNIAVATTERNFPTTGAGGNFAVYSPAAGASIGENAGTAASTATNNATTATNQTTGGGGAHNNLQPYLTLNFIIEF